ncbi:hypothetical protein ABZV14_23760 [Streptosporangium canum]|uniref:hypothetical protein n=1 Tax=Streptosporangium canum TaxID=324952 RepID=UPI0033AC8237
MTSYARRDGSWEVRAFALSLLATRGAHPAELAELADDVASAVTLQGTRGTPGWARRVLQTARDLHRPEG